MNIAFSQQGCGLSRLEFPRFHGRFFAHVTRLLWDEHHLRLHGWCGYSQTYAPRAQHEIT